MRIPRGKVATYGQIARIARLPGQARQVGYALHDLPDGLDVPWHRVINARGTISFPRASKSYLRQEHLLKADGISSAGGKIDLRKFGWRR